MKQGVRPWHSVRNAENKSLTPTFIALFAGLARLLSPALRQAPAGPDVLHKINERNAAILCYLPFVGWIPAIVVLASARFRNMREVRFHAFQGLYLFVAWLLVDWFITPLVSFGPHFGPQRAVVHLLQLVILGAWIFMLVKTSQQQFFRLPVIGEIAERSVAEQR